jgi:hypothetical protein
MLSKQNVYGTYKISEFWFFVLIKKYVFIQSKMFCF